MTLLTPEVLASLLEAAVAAPSADNHHAWRWQVSADRLQIVAQPEPVDAIAGRRILFLLSLGAVIESVRLRAARWGLQADLEWFAAPDPPPAPICSLHFAPAPPVLDDARERVLLQRQSNRRLRFSGPRLADETLAAWDRETADLPGTFMQWLDRPDLRARAVRLVRLAETRRFVEPALHRELFGSVRFDAGWHASTDEGLPPGALGLAFFERPAFAALRRWPLQRLANLVGTQHVMALRGAALPCRWAPHLCAIGAAGTASEAALAAGRLAQRLWLRATAEGLAVQVFAASPLYALPGAAPVPADFQQAHAAQWAQLCPQGRPYLLMRLGRAPAMAVRAGRPSPERLKV